MDNIMLLTDSCSDLPIKYIESNNIKVLSLTYCISGKEYQDNMGKSMDYKDFYSLLRKDKTSTTSQINVDTYVKEFKEALKLKKSIIYICFSSGLSGCINSAQIAKGIVLEDIEDADITIIDSKSASLGQGLLVIYANEMINRGLAKEEVISWIEENKMKVNHYFTVDSLRHLKNGGRISASTAVIGTLLNIKPVLHVDSNGKLIPLKNVQGRKHSLRFLVDKLKERIIHPENQIITISHGDCIKDAEFVRDLICREYKFKDVIINNVGPVIGSHSGPGTVALFFLGKER